MRCDCGDPNCDFEERFRSLVQEVLGHLEPRRVKNGQAKEQAGSRDSEAPEK